MTRHLSEDELIAWQMGERGADASPIRAHLETCPVCAREAEAIAETLRVFSGGPVPTANLERNWQRLRGALPVLHATRAKRAWWQGWGGTARIAAVGFPVLLLVVMLWPRLRGGDVAPAAGMAVLRAPGPLTARPVDPVVAEQISSAERLLTQVNHSSGPLDDATLEQAHELRLRNALYIRSARAEGATGAASVLEELDPVLNSIDHDARTGNKGVRLSLEWNTKGLLLDLRILEQNDTRGENGNRGEQ